MRYGVWVLGLSAVFFSVMARADTISDELFVKPRTHAWVEIMIGHQENGGWDDAHGEQQRDSGTAAIAGGWQPFAEAIKKDDALWLKVLKSIGYSVEVAGHGANKQFDDGMKPIISVDSPLSQKDLGYFHANECKPGNEGCHPCDTGSAGTGFCETHSIWGRDAYIKSVDTSVSVGFYLPVNIADVISIQTGPVLKFYQFADSTYFNEGNTIGIYDDLKPYAHQAPPSYYSWEPGVNWNTNIQIRVFGNAYVAGNYERSITKGFKYQVVSYGVGWRF